MKTTILFDLDGTLIESTRAIVGCFYKSFEELNFEFKGTQQDIEQEIGYPLDIMYRKFGLEEQRIEDAVQKYKLEYRKISKEQTTLLPNTIKALELASTFARLGIVTTKTTKYTIPLLEHLNIMKYFETIIGMQEVTNPKPHPEPIFKCLENMNIIPSKDVYIVGDTKLDLIAGNKANISSIAVLTGYGTRTDLEAHTTNVFDDSYLATKYIKSLY